MTVEWLFQPEALANPDYDIHKVTRFIRTVLEEDAAVCELTQRGMHAGPMRQGVLMPEEYELKAFRDWLLDSLESAENQ